MSGSLVLDTYIDAFNRPRTIDPDARRAVVAAMGGEGAPDGADRVAIVRPGGPLPEPGELILEEGTRIGRVDAVPADTPYGYHRLARDDGSQRLLITGPGRCHLPGDLRAWGWAIQLATTRSSRSWGIGDLGDLRELCQWSGSVGAGFVAVGPLGSPNPGPEPEPSPYYPSTRRFGNPLHIRVEEVPGADALGADLAGLAAEARRLNAAWRIDRGSVLRHKLRALERIWEFGVEREAFETWRRARGESLERWAVFTVLSERFGPGWSRWPAEYRDPRGSAVAAIAAEDADRVSFHAWLQWCFDLQLEAASVPVRRIADMPVGVDPGGFDAWDWQDQLAIGATVGAPPDRFIARGQDWGLPPFIPHRLREAGYRPFIDTIRAQLRHAGGLRIDHVLGLFRLWWIPAGVDPSRGAYVRSGTDELLEIVALESHRAGAVVIGEDLGTVPSGVRSELRRRQVLSTRLALFERTRPSRYPRQAFAGVTTHDLPTIAGIWNGSDLADQAAAGLEPDVAGLSLLRGRLGRAAGVTPDAGLDDVTDAVHRNLAAAPPMLVAATLEDALRVEERPNIPGTVFPQRDNWSLPLPVSVDDLRTDPRVASVVEALRRS